MKRFKAITMPQGAAGEYAKYSLNFYKGCNNGCTYCYTKRFGWGDAPTLKKCFRNENHALECLERDIRDFGNELRQHGLFFSFTTDPMLPETIELTKSAIELCDCHAIPQKILTKCAYWIYDFIDGTNDFILHRVRDTALGFTLTGRDELEPNASPSEERIKAMRKLHAAGFKTWASVEPVIDFSTAVDMIVRSMEFCDLYKIGLLSGKSYDVMMLKTFVHFVSAMRRKNDEKITVYFKDGLLKQAGIRRDDLPENCVGRDFNMFN